MDVFDYFSSHHAQFLFLLAGLGLVIELTIIGLSGPLLFFSIACLFTAILTSMGILNSWESETLTVGSFTAIIAAVLWRPLKRFQNSGGGPDTSSDMIGKHVSCATEITKLGGSIRYSGIDWRARLDSNAEDIPISEGAYCIISGVDGNVMIVRPLEKN